MIALLAVNMFAFAPGIPSRIAAQWVRFFYGWPQRDSLSKSYLVRAHVLLCGCALIGMRLSILSDALYRVSVTAGSLSALTYSSLHHPTTSTRLAFAMMALAVLVPIWLFDSIPLSVAALEGSFFVFRLSSLTWVRWLNSPSAQLLNIYLSWMIPQLVTACILFRF